MVLLKVRPGAVGELAARLPGGVGLVSATNGKTTTARLITACLRADGRVPVANRAGANLLSGVATALLETQGRTPAPDCALFEVDEAALPAVAAQSGPRAVVLMNLFRDQLDRYGELETLAARWAAMVAGLPATTRLVVNADDPAVAALAPGRPGVVRFGVEDPALALPALPHAADSTRCRRCEAPLDYSAVFLGHLGHWRCPACGLERQAPEVRVTRVELDGVRGSRVHLTTPAGAMTVDIALPGVHNAYNAAAAVAGALAMGVTPARIAPALAGAQAAFGRAERVALEGREVVLLLAKNPTGANENVRTVLLDPAPLHLLVALNDRTADGRDVSWIWDVDYEPLLERIASLTLAGDRAHDLALRFRYAGLDPAVMRVAPGPDEAIDGALAATPAGGTLYLLPTYTAMHELRAVLVRRGAAADFWRDGDG
ncbi:MAG: MurT ligase domain-containing protein [Thermoleophilia bacterium]|nr:MurT ligase domain-containing protein [Thermoleophilia bacterium]